MRVHLSADRDDLYQDVCLAIWRSPKRFLNRFLVKRRRLSGWLCSVAFHVACKRIDSKELGWMGLPEEDAPNRFDELAAADDELGLAPSMLEPLLDQLVPESRTLIQARFGLP